MLRRQVAAVLRRRVLGQTPLGEAQLLLVGKKAGQDKKPFAARHGFGPPPAAADGRCLHVRSRRGHPFGVSTKAKV
jgi:hypothetical protein